MSFTYEIKQQIIARWGGVPYAGKVVERREGETGEGGVYKIKFRGFKDGWIEERDLMPHTPENDSLRKAEVANIQRRERDKKERRKSSKPVINQQEQRGAAKSDPRRPSTQSSGGEAPAKKRKVDGSPIERADTPSPVSKQDDQVDGEAATPSRELARGAIASALTLPPTIRHALEEEKALLYKKKMLPLPRKVTVKDVLARFCARRQTRTPKIKQAERALETALVHLFNACLGRRLLYAYERVQYAQLHETAIKEKRPLPEPASIYGVEHLLRLLQLLPTLTESTPATAQTYLDGWQLQALHALIENLRRTLPKALAPASEYEAMAPEYLRLCDSFAGFR